VTFLDHATNKVANFSSEVFNSKLLFTINVNLYLHCCRVKSKLVETVKQDPSVSIKRIYNTVVRRHQQGGGDVTSIPRFSNIRSAMTINPFD
jgi:hypothetical protein